MMPWKGIHKDVRILRRLLMRASSLAFSSTWAKRNLYKAYRSWNRACGGFKCFQSVLTRTKRIFFDETNKGLQQ